MKRGGFLQFSKTKNISSTSKDCIEGCRPETTQNHPLARSYSNLGGEPENCLNKLGSRTTKLPYSRRFAEMRHASTFARFLERSRFFAAMIVGD